MTTTDEQIVHQPWCEDHLGDSGPGFCGMQGATVTLTKQPLDENGEAGTLHVSLWHGLADEYRIELEDREQESYDLSIDEAMQLARALMDLCQTAVAAGARAKGQPSVPSEGALRHTAGLLGKEVTEQALDALRAGDSAGAIAAVSEAVR